MKCIFCESTNVHLTKKRLPYKHKLSAFVQCHDCHAQGPLMPASDMAISKWNKINELLDSCDLPDTPITNTDSTPTTDA